MVFGKPGDPGTSLHEVADGANTLVADPVDHLGRQPVVGNDRRQSEVVVRQVQHCIGGGAVPGDDVGPEVLWRAERVEACGDASDQIICHTGAVDLYGRRPLT